MKLLILTVIPAPYQRDLFRAIDATGVVDLSVFYYRGSASDREWGSTDLYPFETIMDGRTFDSLGASAHWNPGAMRDIMELSPDLAVVSDYSAPTAQYVMRGLARRKMPFAFWGEMPGFQKRGFIGNMLRRELQSPLRKAEAIVGIGSRAVDVYGALFPGKKIYNIPYYCDLSRYRDAAKEQSDQGGDAINILFSGQMIERKGLPLLLSAFDRIARKHPRLRLMLLGGGPAMAEYRAMVSSDITERVTFLGHQDPKSLPDFFAQADIFCLPSRHDGWGVVVNEALGAGLPIIVTDTVGAGPDLVEIGENGFIVPLGDVDALADALDQVAGDDALRARMSERSAALSYRWDVEEGARLFVEAAKEIVAGVKKV